jgi:hypothetical protein
MTKHRTTRQQKKTRRHWLAPLVLAALAVIPAAAQAGPLIVFRAARVRPVVVRPIPVRPVVVRAAVAAPVMVKSAVAAPVVVKAHKKVWVPGHYRHNRFGCRVWVPGHWKRA